MDHIVRQKGFWSEDDETVLKAIKEGFIQTHQAMWKELRKFLNIFLVKSKLFSKVLRFHDFFFLFSAHWPKTASGLPSTAGTTASIAFIRRGKIYTGHVGDSAIVLGQVGTDDQWEGVGLTREHKPECPIERKRIDEAGGKVAVKSGVPRVVWKRPKMGHKGAIRRSTPVDEIPFLAVARSLGKPN